MRHLASPFKVTRSLFLTGVFLALCHCGGGSPASTISLDAKDAVPADAGTPDLATIDARLAVDTPGGNPVDAAIEVPPATQADANPETTANAPDTRPSASDVVVAGDVATGQSVEGGVSLDLAAQDSAIKPDLGPVTTDARLDSTPDQGIDARATSEVGTDATVVGPDLGGFDASGQCNNLDDSVAPLHDEVYVDGPAPLPTGGVIADGLYYESAAEIYSTGKPAGPSGSQRRMVMRIAGSLIQAAYFTSSSGEHRWESDTIGPGSADAGASTLGLAQVCLSPGSRTLLSMDLGYSVVGSGAGATLKFIYPTITFPGLGSQNIVLTLVRQ